MRKLYKTAKGKLLICSLEAFYSHVLMAITETVKRLNAYIARVIFVGIE